MERAKQWIAPLAAIILAAAAALWFSAISNHYIDRHDWPEILPVVAWVLGIYGAAMLFWAVIPTGRKGQVVFTCGIVLMLISWIVYSEVSGVVVGAVATMVGYSLMTLRTRI